MTALHRPAPPTAADPRRWWALAVLAASLLVVVMDMTILTVALPEMAAELRLGAMSQLWVVDAYALALAGLLIPVTALGDRWGRKRMLVTGYAAFALGSVAILWADDAATVIAIRALLGVGGAMVMPSTLSLIRSVFADARERTLALSVWGATAALGAAVGPVVGGALLESFSWHSAFLVNVPLMVVAIAAAAWLLRENRSSRPGRIDPVGVVLSAGGMTAFVYAAKQLGKHGPDLGTLALLALGAAMLTVFARRALASSRPMLDVRIFASPVLRAGVVAALASSAAMVSVLYVGSQWLQLVEGWSPLGAGVALLPLALGAMVASPFAPALAERTSPRAVLAGGLVVLSLGLALIAVVPATYPWIAVAFTVVGLGTSALGLGSALIMGAATDDQAGSAAATEEITYELGAVLGITFLGSLVGAVYRAGLPGSADGAVRESVAGAVGGPWFAEAADAFVTAFAAVGAVGAVLCALAAVAVWRLVPGDLTLDDAHH
ncbi:DHA2 family multidrug resistance protein-like MFS transporter [Nocardioides cavernae]|uniref:DHA2 family multidrug resistance protein-like MFS transporter n=1 Tax=Nocardioides cavernae TaxID=1921566 RepID=A0A7Y9KST6_9ACTN|nr:MFS transporter [Nocardioides cavernae]NYE36148.1 DHA2 family multidrug resistance protein-like MFS transporter [Nocardioides cavernae]